MMPPPLNDPRKGIHPFRLGSPLLEFRSLDRRFGGRPPMASGDSLETTKMGNRYWRLLGAVEKARPNEKFVGVANLG